MSDDPTGRILAAIEAVRSDLAQTSAALTAEIANLAQTSTALKAEMANLAQMTSALAADLVKTRAALMARMDRLQNELTLRNEDAMVNMGAAERAERIAKAASDEVRAMGDMVTTMARQIQRLQTEVRQLRGEQ
jgi:methyl-accepting chemotaxis protein